MHPSGFGAGAALVLLVFWEAFETIVYPRRVSRRFRLTRMFYRVTWLSWRTISCVVPAGERREAFLSVYGPLSLLALLALWAVLLVVGFALLHWGGGSQLQAPHGVAGFAADLYFSGATIFTLSLGDMAPASTLGRVFTVLEAGTGIALLAMVIGYLPSLQQAFSRREADVTSLDAHAGSPPNAGELLVRHEGPKGEEALARLLEHWERWAGELMETHVSFPVLTYYRSQHEHRSWVAALTTILDACALIMAGLEQGPTRTARTTFAIARHAAIDLSHALRLETRPLEPGRRPAPRRAVAEMDAKLDRLRQTYEPHLTALAEYLLMPLPSWWSPEEPRDD
jgi:Ion channel